MIPGYSYEKDGNAIWQNSKNDDWDITVYTPTGKEQRLGNRWIDGSHVTVFACPDGVIRAQLSFMIK